MEARRCFKVHNSVLVLGLWFMFFMLQRSVCEDGALLFVYINCYIIKNYGED